MNRGRVAAVVALQVAIAVGCGSFGSDDDKPSAPSGGDGGAADGASSGNPPIDVETDAEAGRPPFSCDALPVLGASSNRDRQCWDFNSDDAGLARNVTQFGLFELDRQEFVSPPASLRTRITAVSEQQIARGLFELPKLTPGLYRIELSLHANDCQGGSTNDGGAPPSLLELYCYGPTKANEGAIVRLERASPDEFQVVGADLRQASANVGPLKFKPPADAWFHLVIEAPLFGAAEPLRVAVDEGAKMESTTELSLRCPTGSSSVQLLVGVQDSNAKNLSNVHYDDVIFEYPRP